MQRVMLETARAAEYFSVKELQAQTGQAAENFASVILKELVDNGLDACESAGVPPAIGIAVNQDEESIQIVVQDNGLGIDPSAIQRILNFETRTSDKAAYKAPTRGAQGNALKTIFGMPYALGSAEPVIIESKNVRHSVCAWVDPAGELMSTITLSDGPVCTVSDGESRES
jgi:DNA topoisomerase VI subunit B